MLLFQKTEPPTQEVQLGGQAQNGCGQEKWDVNYRGRATKCLCPSGMWCGKYPHHLRAVPQELYEILTLRMLHNQSSY